MVKALGGQALEKNAPNHVRDVLKKVFWGILTLLGLPSTHPRSRTKNLFGKTPYWQHEGWQQPHQTQEDMQHYV